MTTQLIVLNGGPSSGKSGIARCLQAILPDPWLTLGEIARGDRAIAACVR